MKNSVILFILSAILLAACQKEVIEVPEVEPLHFFRISYEANESERITRYFQSYTVKFSVNDPNCSGWSFEMPTQVTVFDAPVKVTPLINLTGDEILAHPIAGIRLEPSGTQLTEPLKVTVTVENSINEQPVIFYMVDDEGNTTDMPEQSRLGDQYTIWVTHFSGLVALAPLNIEGICEMAEKAIPGSMADAAKLIVEDPKISVEPVSYEPKCDTGRMLSLRVNIIKMLEPERTAIANLLSSERTSHLTCGSSDTSRMGMARKLAAQTVKKALKAIEDNKTKPDKYTAISIFAIMADRQLSLLGLSSYYGQVMSKLSEYLTANIAYYNKKIKEEHDLTYLKMLISMYRDVSLIGQKDNIIEMLQTVKDLIRFKLELEVGVYREARGGNWTQNDQTITRGSAYLVYDIEKFMEYGYFPDPGFTEFLMGTGEFTTEGTSVNQSGSETIRSTVSPEKFLKEYSMEFNMCEYRGKIFFFSPGNENEKWVGNEALSSTLMFPVFTNTYFDMLNLYGEHEGFVEFRFQNRKEVLMDDVLVVRKIIDNQTIRTELNYKVIHEAK